MDAFFHSTRLRFIEEKVPVPSEVWNLSTFKWWTHVHTIGYGWIGCYRKRRISCPLFLMKTYQGWDAKVHHVWANMAPPGLDWNSRCHSSFAYLLRSVLPETTGFFVTTARFYPKENPSDLNRFFFAKKRVSNSCAVKPFWNNTGGVCLTQTWTTETTIPLKPRPDVKESHFMDRKKTHLWKIHPSDLLHGNFHCWAARNLNAAAARDPTPSVAAGSRVHKLLAFTEDSSWGSQRASSFFS